jgi:protein SERAC1
MDISSLIPMVEYQSNRFLLESVGHINSQILNIQQREFHKALGIKGNSEIFCFYETLQSSTAQKVSSLLIEPWNS